MISIIEGKLGGGKTYNAVSRLLTALADGRHVATNIELSPVGCANWLRKRKGVSLDLSRIHQITDVYEWHRTVPWGLPGANVLAVLDELHLFYGSRDWSATAQRKDMLSFLSQSRKACVDVICITQHAQNLDSQFRRLAQEVLAYRDLALIEFPLVGKALAPWFVEYRFDYVGELLGSRLVRKDPLIFAAYDTRSMLDASMKELTLEARRVNAEPLPKVPWFRRA